MIPIKEKEAINLFLLLTLLSLLFGTPGNIYCQDTGLKYFKNYSPNEYNLSPQNWIVSQDKRGVIYVGNTGGLLEFDGVSWREISVPNWLVRSFAFDDTGTLYIGGKNELGFLAPDAKGALKYVSLLDHLNKKYRNFSNVWQTCSTGEGIYFRTSKYLFRWNSQQLNVWEPGHNISAVFYCNGKLFVQEKEAGLKEMIGDSLKLVPGGEKFVDEKIHMMVPYDSKRLLIGTRLSGLYFYDGISFVPFLTAADEYLKEKQLYHGTRLTNGHFALATLRGGLVIIDAGGGLEQIFNKASGLRDDNVKYVYEDSQGNLWLAFNNGIAKIEYASPFSAYGERLNLTGIVLSVTRHGPGNDLYAGTTSGLYFPASHGGTGIFHPVPGMTGYCWSLLTTGDSLLAATGDGVFQVKYENNTNRMILKNHSYVLYRSPTDPNRTWVGTRGGLVSLYKKNGNGQWREEYRFKDINQEIRTIVEEKGNLWLGTLDRGVFKAEFPSTGNMSNPRVTHFDTSHGLPPKEVNVFMAAGHVMFASAKGIFRFDEKNNVFLPDVTFGEQFANGSRSVFRITEDKDKQTWIHSRFKNFLAVPGPAGTYVLKSRPFLRMHDTQVNAIYPEPGGTATWFACNDGLVRYDTTAKKNYNFDFPTLIRKVWLNGNLAFDGCKYKAGNESGGLFPIIDYKDRNLRFEFAAPFHEGEPATRYQCLLEGYDDGWTAWNKETKKDYTNLDPGIYTFRVRARNVYEVLSREDVFLFKILPPWYKTWWAFFIYALGFLVLILLIVKWRSQYLEHEKQELEKIVKDRTKEIEEQKHQLENQTIQLARQSGKLKEMDKVKSRFFANISHEFRTPLTLIMGPLEQILANTPNKDELEKKTKMMLRNSQRLLNLINQLLDLSKLDGGEMKLQASIRDIMPFLKGIAASFEPATTQKNLDLTFHAAEENIALYFDPEKIEEVVSNLLSNAVKFTPAGGKITMAVKRNPAKDAGFLAGSVEISVRDTGPGISRDQLANIFDRFYQAESTYEYHQKGSGIGLAIAKELVELHHGKIEARSGDGEGTAFIIHLPSGDAHLKPEEIIKPGVPVDAKPGVPVDIPDVPVDVPGVPVDAPGVPADIKPEKDIILLVEDNADVRDYMKGALEPLYSVLEAADGGEGIQKAREIIPDLIISDIMMPGPDGYELCRVLKNDVHTSHIPIILLTAKAAEENIIEGLETGADDYITKPFSTKILCARIKNLIEIRSQLQQNMKREMTLQPVKMSVSNIDKEFLNDLQAVIDTNIADPEFNVEELCKKLYMGRTTLYRKISALSGETPKEFVRSYRLKRAAELLKKKPGTVLEVSFEVGFSSSSYFAKCFKEKFHQLPSQYQTSESEC